jgi:hypothetical protein
MLSNMLARFSLLGKSTRVRINKLVTLQLQQNSVKSLLRCTESLTCAGADTRRRLRLIVGEDRFTWIK